MKKFSAKQLAQQQRFKEMVQNKSAAKKGTSPGPVPAPAGQLSENSSGSGNTIWIVLGLVVVAGIAYWYFTRDKKQPT